MPRLAEEDLRQRDAERDSNAELASIPSINRTMPMHKTTVTSKGQVTIPKAVRQQCDGIATFDDRRFVCRAQRLGLLPPVPLCR